MKPFQRQFRSGGRACQALHLGAPLLAGKRSPRAGRNLGRQAFTLVELMIVVAILSLLVMFAIPAYQQARSAALIGSVLGELVSYGKACAVVNSTGLGEKPTPPAVSPVRGGVVIRQGCEEQGTGATLEASWGEVRAEGVPCLNSRSSKTSGVATLEVSSLSIITCTFQN